MQHNSLTDIHRIVSYIYPTSAARLAAGPFNPEDTHKVAFQQSDQTYHILLSNLPIVWVPLPTGTTSLTGILGGDLYGTPSNAGVVDDSHSHAPGVSIPAYPISLPPSGPAGGVLSGTFPNPSLALIPGLTPGTYKNPTLTINNAGQITSAVNRTHRIITVNTSISAADRTVFCNSASNNIIVTLPNPATCIGDVFTLIKTSTSNTVTISAQIGTISSLTNLVLLNKFDVINLISDGTDFYSIGTAEQLIP